MNNPKSELTRIADALETIASILQNFKPTEHLPTPLKEDAIIIENNFICHTPWILEEELFIKTIMIYLQETIRKDVESLKRKSGVKVSKELVTMQISFIKKHLRGYDVYEHEGGVLVISKEDVPKALLRFYTDLGFHRGTWWANDIQELTSYANTLNISPENIFIIVLSNINGLDNTHVCATLNQNISNKELIDPANLQVLKKYCTLYIDNFKNLLPHVQNQIYFLAGDLHPNVVAQELYDNSDITIDLTTYPWISTPLSTIFSTINSI